MPAFRGGSKRSPGGRRTWRPASAATIARPSGDHDGPVQAGALAVPLGGGGGRCRRDRHYYTNFRDEAGLRAECVAARRSGFAAKMAIHPAQLGAVNETFSVSAAEREWAERVVALFDANPDSAR